MNTRGLDDLSPFQLEDELIRRAKAQSASQAPIHKFLNAGECQSARGIAEVAAMPIGLKRREIGN